MYSDRMVEQVMIGMFVVTILIPIILFIAYIVFAFIVDKMSRDRLRRNLDMYNEMNRNINHQNPEPIRLDKNFDTTAENNINKE